MPDEIATRQAQEALERLPQRRPASLYDVAVQYAIFDWYETVTSGDLDFDLAPEHLAFMTPSAKQDLFDEQDNALVVYVDLSVPEDPSFREDSPVRLESVGPGMRFRLGHSYPTNKTSAMTDYSITTHKEAPEHHLAGQRDDAWGTNNIKDRFTEWAHSDAADRVLDQRESDDTYILKALRALGNDESVFDEIVSRPDFPLDPTDEETEHEVFVTVRVRLPNEERYRWPGEVEILNEVMVEQKADRFENISVDDAGGEGVSYVSGDSGRVTGGSGGVLGMYAKKQREHFPDLSADGSSAWRNRPLTHETAASIATANSVFGEFFQSLGNSRRLYVLPYLRSHPDNIDPAQFHAFVTDVFSVLRNTEDFESTVSDVFYRRENTDREQGLGLFAEETSTGLDHIAVASVFVVTGNPDRVFFEATRTDMFRPRDVDESQATVLRTAPFEGDGIFAEQRQRSQAMLLSPQSELEGAALFGSYFQRTTEPTRSSKESDDTPKAGDIDDVRARRLRQFLTGERIPVDTLLEEYLHLLVQNQRDLFSQDDTTNVPASQVLQQYAQLRALWEIDALGPYQVGSDELIGEPHTNDYPTHIAAVSEIDSPPEYDSRSDRLEDFIDSHDVLSNSESRQAVFLLGGLVGRISSYQRVNEVSSTLVRRYPIDYLTKQSIKEVTNEVLQMNTTYVESDEELPSTYNARYTNRLPDLMLTVDPGEWDFAQNELQWLYALGITYGMNDTKINSEE